MVVFSTSSASKTTFHKWALCNNWINSYQDYWYEVGGFWPARWFWPAGVLRYSVSTQVLRWYSDDNYSSRGFSPHSLTFPSHGYVSRKYLDPSVGPNSKCRPNFEISSWCIFKSFIFFWYSLFHIIRFFNFDEILSNLCKLP